MNAREKEIRRILTGFTAQEDGAIVAADSLIETSFEGSYSGAPSVRILGLASRRKQFRLKIKTAQVRQTCEKAFSEMGVKLKLRSVPDAIAILRFPLLQNPCVMTAEIRGSNVLVCFYSAKTVMAFLNASTSYSKWKKKMPPDTVTEVDADIVEQIVEPAEPYDDHKSEKSQNSVNNQKGKSKKHKRQ